MSDNMSVLYILYVMYALHENLVLVTDLFQLKLKLRCVWWLCFRVYSLCEKVMMSLGEDTASSDKRRRQAAIKEEDKQQ